MTSARASLVKAILPLLVPAVVVFRSAALPAADEGFKVALAGPSSDSIVSHRTRESLPAKRKELPADGTWGQISGTSVHLRNGPGMQSAVIATLNGGDFVKPVALCGSWMEISWPENVPLFVPKSSLQLKTSSSALVAEDIFARAHNSLQAAPAARLARGSTVAVAGLEGNWYKITAPQTVKAYLSAKYVVTGVRRIDSLAVANLSGAGEAKKAVAPQVQSAAPQRTENAKSLVEEIKKTRSYLQEALPGSNKENTAARRAEIQSANPGEFLSPVETGQPLVQAVPRLDAPMEYGAFEEAGFSGAMTILPRKFNAPIQITTLQGLAVFPPLQELPAKISPAPAAQPLPAVTPAAPAKISPAEPSQSGGSEVKVMRIPYVAPAEPVYAPPAEIVAIREDELPTPGKTGPAAPSARHLQPQHRLQAWHADSSVLATVEGILLPATTSPVKGASCLVQKDDASICLLIPNGELGLENLVGRRVIVSGTPLRSGSLTDTVIEATTVSAQE